MTMVLKTDEPKAISRASEGGHWYTKEGKPRYTIAKKDGKGMRNTTLRDARAEGLVYAVSTVLAMAAKPGLDRWKRDQVFEASQNVPRISQESLEEYKHRVMDEADKVSAKAREKGTAVHTVLENFYLGQPIDVNYARYVSAVEQAILQHIGAYNWGAEESFAHPTGYGGKCDLKSECKRVLLDFKTKDKDFGADYVDLASAKAAIRNSFLYSEHAMQLAAYREGFIMPNATCYNVFISVAEGCEGQIAIYRHEEEDIYNAWHKFLALLEFTKLEKKYNPAF